MPSSSRSSRQQRSRRNRIAKSPEALEQRRLLDGDGGRIVLEAFEDYNGNGIYEPDGGFFEESIYGISELTLFKDDGDLEFNEALDQPLASSYFYFYEDLDFGRYFAVDQGYQAPGSPRTVLTTPSVVVFDLDAENPEDYAEFGYWYTGTLDLTIFYDTNANGVRDNGESLVEGKTSFMVLDVEDDFSFIGYVLDGSTGGNWWRRDGDTQTLTFGNERDDGLVVTTPDPVTVVYEAAMRETAEFGVVDGASIQIVGYSDTTGDGRTTDDTQFDILGYGANVLITGQTLNGQVIDTDLEELIGENSTVKNLLPGSYTLELVSENDQLQLFSTEPFTRQLEVGAGDSLYVDFSVFVGRSIEKQIDSLVRYLDHNSYAGIVVELFRDNGDGSFDPQQDTLLASVTTDAEARFSIPSFGAGSYFLATRMGPSYTPLDIYFARDFVAESKKVFDKHLSVPTSAIGVEVYVDANFNGIFEPRELGLQGVKLTLQGVDIFGNFVEEEEFSRYDGDYTFYSLMPGTYSIIQQQPTGYQSGLETAGEAGGVTSANRIDNIDLGPSERAKGYQFGEYGSPDLRPARPDTGDYIGVFEPQTSWSFLKRTNSPGYTWADFQYGTPGSKVVAGDWNNDGYDAIGIFDPDNGLFRLKNENRNSAEADDLTPFVYGGAGFVPVAGDWNFDGTDSVGVFDPTTAAFYLRNSNDSGVADAGQFIFGRPGWIPLAGDWDGDGHDGIGVYDPETATFYLRNSLSAGSPDIEPFNFGMPGWKPIAGDWDDDGIVTVGGYNPDTATFFLRNSNSTGVADITPFNHGGAGWEPIVGDWNTSRAALTKAIALPGGLWTSPVQFAPPIIFDASFDDYLRGDSAGLQEAIDAAANHSALITHPMGTANLRSDGFSTLPQYSPDYVYTEGIELENLAFDRFDEDWLDLLAVDQL